MRRLPAILSASLVLLVPELAMAQGAGPAPRESGGTSVGLKAEALDSDDLDSIEEELGVRAGVLIGRVTAGSAAAKAGLKKGDIILFVQEKPVDSPAALDRVLAAASGDVSLIGARPGEDDEFTPIQVTIKVPAGGASASGDAGKAKSSAGSGDAKDTPKGGDPAARLQALEKAHELGVLSDEEYERKRAEIEVLLAPKPDAASEVDEATRKKLEALEAAHAAGILSDEELQRKEAELLAAGGKPKPPALDEAAKKKLEALEAAHASGVLSDEELERKRAEILGAGSPAAAGGAPAGPGPEAKKGKMFRHPVGFSFWYPDGWTTQEQESFLQLVPPDPGSAPEGPTEVYGVSGESVAGQGIKSADDRRVVEYFDQQATQLLPNLRRKGEPAKADTAKGKGIVLRYEGTNPKGDPVIAISYVAVINDFAVGLVAIGLKKPVEAREADLRRMFATFGFGEGQRDPKLVGNWTCEKFYSSGTFSSTTVLHMGLDRSGKFVRSSNLYASMTHTDSTGDTVGSTSVDSGPSPGERGQWSAADGKLYLLYDDGSYAEYKYEVSGGNMLLQWGKDKKELWTGG